MDAGVFTLIERCFYFSLGSQPVRHRITTFEATMFGKVIGGNGNMIMMSGCLKVMLGCLVINGSLFM